MNATRWTPPFAALLAIAFAAGCAKLPRKSEATVPPEAAKAQMAELWMEPADLATRDLVHGPGGPALMPAPGATFQFVSKDTKGYSWGWDVTDATGMEWSVKYGPEAQSEVAASRIVWAMGYHQPAVYHVTQWTLAGGPEAGPKMPARFRPNLPRERRKGEWSWHRNPFVGTTEFKGLLVLMRILNNWDLLDRNTAIFGGEAPGGGGPARRYVVIDLGASLGRTRVVPDSGTRNDIEDFEQQGFVKGVEKGFVEFDDLGRWHREMFQDVTPADLRWTCERLARLTDAQWKDAFRGAGYTDEMGARFIRKIKEKVANGLALSAGR